MNVVVYVIAMIVILTVAAAVAGMVLVGKEGRVNDRLARHPQLSEFLSHAASHLNGEVAETRSSQPGSQPTPRVRERV